MTRRGFADAIAAIEKNAAMAAASTETRIALIGLPSSLFACLTSGVPDRYAAAVRPDCSLCAAYSYAARSHGRPTPGYPDRDERSRAHAVDRTAAAGDERLERRRAALLRADARLR